MSSRSRPVLIVSALVLVCLVVAGAYVVFFMPRLPSPGSPRYEQYAEAFQVGVAALDAGLTADAEKNLTQAVKLVPKEPAAWADRGLLYIRTNQLDQAAEDLQRAQVLAGDRPEILKLFGLLEQRRGEFSNAARYLRQAIELTPNDIEAIFRLATVVNQEQLSGSDAEYQRLLERVLELRPENLRVLIDRLRIAVRRADRAAVDDSLARFQELSKKWSEETRTQLTELSGKFTAELDAQSISGMLPFANVLRSEPAFERSVDDVDPPDRFVGTSLQNFLLLAPIQHMPAAPDMNLTFAPKPSVFAPDETAPDMNWPAAIFVANANELAAGRKQIAWPADAFQLSAILAFDWNNDFHADLLSYSDGVHFWQQSADGKFTDATSATKLEADLLNASYAHAWRADLDNDGDLDVVLAATFGAPIMLRNNFDGTFAAMAFLPEIATLRAFVYADFDRDGAPDVASIDESGVINVFANERGGKFVKWPETPSAETFDALTVMDANDDGVPDLIALRNDGAVLRFSDKNKREGWEIKQLVQSKIVKATDVNLLAADWDNSGTVDLLASSLTASQIWLGEGAGKFQELELQLPPRIVATVDLNSDGRLDLLAAEDGTGPTTQLLNSGSKKYHWQAIRPRSVPGEDTKGDNRINSFGIGGEIEVLAGSHIVTQSIDSPVVHFGLGQRPSALVVRVLWPNGTHQVELTPPVDQIVIAEQRLKGSCPFLFAFNGQRFEFVKDFMWSSPLGMYINAQTNGVAAQTTDWIRIRGDQLVARNGVYELRVNANLWETHFFDQLSLIAVDHPVDTEMIVDERFFPEPTKPAFYITSPPQPVTRAVDHHGMDATSDVFRLDGVYLDRCGRGKYQGIASEHWVEVELTDEPSGEGPLCLLASGWIHPTDSSVNFAIEQGQHEKPHGLVLEMPDGQGGWRIVQDQIGFPAGKLKTIVVRLENPDTGESLRRFRLRTNMEIHWDALQVARIREDVLTDTHHVSPSRADLRFRGILGMSQANPSSPELPAYDRVVSHGQHWRDLIGFHTRFGDVKELLEKTDDRYAILSAGDEIVLEFQAPPPPTSGWIRDFVWVADGWVKDGDLNTRFSKTVLPLPSHAMTSYDRPASTLDDDPVYQQHAADWDRYHTRFITPSFFERGLRSVRVPTVVSDGRTP